MIEHKESCVVDTDVQTMFNLVADIESYPTFLPWCLNVSIVSRDQECEIDGVKMEKIIADLRAGFGALQDTYRSCVLLDRESNKILVNHISGPFKELTNVWTFKNITNEKCHVDFYIAFAFKNPMLQTLMGGFFSQAFGKMLQAFVKRASEI